MQHFEAYDPLTQGEDDQSLILATRKRHIHNLLKSYTEWFDLFAELLQNALDAVEKRANEETAQYEPQIWIKVDIEKQEISVTDNGCGMEKSEFQTFLKPDVTFKIGEKTKTRGMKGVGATYLAYGFNHFQVSTKTNNEVWSGVIRKGREWVENKTDTTPKFIASTDEPPHNPFGNVDRGTSVTIRLEGKGIRPKDLAWIGATNAEQWLALLRVHTPVGAIYIHPEQPYIQIRTNVEVVARDGAVSRISVDNPEYLYPHDLFGSVLELDEFVAWIRERADQGIPTDKRPARFMSQTGFWAQADTDELLKEGGLFGVQLSDEQIDLAKELRLQLYVFMGCSKSLWNRAKENLGLSTRIRLLKGGIQLATRHMPQGDVIPITLTRYVFFQDVAHAIVHIDAEPDYGRKGFQLEHVEIAKHFAQRAVMNFARKYQNLLRSDSGTIDMVKSGRLENWIDQQKIHESLQPLHINKTHFFEPVGYLPTTSEPRSEQDVVALFNQLLSTGVIRGIEIISSSQYEQYDGLFRYVVAPPFSKYKFDKDRNPLGVINEALPPKEERIGGRVEVLEYKLRFDDLIDDFAKEIKDPSVIKLIITWELGENWQSLYSITSFLASRNVQHRKNHGITHRFMHSDHSGGVFDAIILQDLIGYLNDPKAEEQRQLRLYD